MLRTKVPGGNELINSEWLLKEKVGLGLGMKVGDFGCGGGGYFALQAARLVGSHGQVYAVDILKSVLNNVLSRARSLGIENIVTVWSNLEVFGATKVTDGSLDAGLLINILFQNKEPGMLLKEAARMIRKGGALLVVDWKEGRFPLGPLPQDKVMSKAVRETAASLGLKEKDSFDAGTFHFGLLFEKL
jgi:ubiquinone/menaquinone biosynthesis C-methylase UbiE